VYHARAVSCRGLLAAALLALAACGGGGGGGATGPAAPPLFEVSTSASGGGSVAPASASVTRGDSASFTLVPDEGYRIQSATGCGGSLAGDTYTTGPVNAACTISASFELLTWTLSGTVIVPATTIVDSDVNDPFAPLTPNDSFDQAQPIPNPGTVGGYVNRPGTGPEGRSFAAGDVSDYFVVDLLAGQQIALFQGTAPVLGSPDLDLLLHDAARNLVDASMGTGSAESLTVPVSGRYYIQVLASEGASNYVLTVGQSLAISGTGARLSDDFLPGEVVARWREDRPPATRQAARREAWARAGLRPRGREDMAETLLKLEPSARREARLARLERQLPQARAVQAAATHERERLETLLALKALAAEPELVEAEPNFVRRTALLPNDSLVGLQWHYSMINLPAAWDLTTGSRDVIVAVVDSGILPGHPDLQGQLVPGYDFISNIQRALDGDGIDPDPTDPGDGSPTGSSFHGTHVAGTIGATTNNQVGVAGVAWDVGLMPLRVLGRNGEGSTADIREAIRYAAGLPNASGTVPARRADIINLSLGGSGFSSLDQQLINTVRGLGIIVVAAAGNQNSSAPFYPAAYSGVLGVSAVQIDRSRAPYSSFGSHVDLAAPGGGTTDLNGDGYIDGVLSTSGNDAGQSLRYNYSFQQGTSMAAPHVSGVLALMKAVNPELDAAQVDQLLVTGQLTEPLGDEVPNPQFGYGLIDARRAVEAALQGGSGQTPAVLAANPRGLSFGLVLDVLELTVRNNGDGALQLGGISSDQDWLEATPLAVDGDGLGTWRIAVQRHGLPPSVYGGTLTLSSTAGELEVPVLMQVADGLVVGDVGRLYILLLDPETGETVDQVDVLAANGGYPFTFSGVRPGTYQVITGTDLNNDNFVCDPGEACGTYLTLDAPKLLEVEGDRAGLDFPASFGATISGSASAQRRRSGEAGTALRQ
jgi:serine protease